MMHMFIALQLTTENALHHYAMRAVSKAIALHDVIATCVNATSSSSPALSRERVSVDTLQVIVRDAITLTCSALAVKVQTTLDFAWPEIFSTERHSAYFSAFCSAKEGNCP